MLKSNGISQGIHTSKNWQDVIISTLSLTGYRLRYKKYVEETSVILYQQLCGSFHIENASSGNGALREITYHGRQNSLNSRFYQKELHA